MQAAFLHQRRTYLRLIGGLTVVGLTGIPVVAYFSDRDASPQRPHILPSTTGDLRHRWLSYAACAPSSHNFQQWLVDLRESSDTITLYVDPQRLLLASDHAHRETFISIGSFLELLSMAIQADGYTHDLTLFPEGDYNPKQPDSMPVARLKISQANQRHTDSLFDYILKRHTNRSAYRSNAPIADNILSTLLVTAANFNVHSMGTVQSDWVTRIGDHALNAVRVEATTPAVVLEILKAMRIGQKEINHHRDGIAIKGILPELAAAVGLFPRDQMPKADSSILSSMVTQGESQAKTAGGWVWLYTDGNTRQHQIDAGRAFVRTQLAATQAGIATQPMSQALEDYPEMRPHLINLHTELGTDPKQHTLQMLVRIGYADSIPAFSARRNLNDFIRG